MARQLSSILICLLGAVAIAACGSTSSGAARASLSGASDSQPDAGSPSASLAEWRGAVACARRHGMPRLPDPVLGAKGQVMLPGYARVPTPTPAVQSACAAQIRAIQSTGGVDAAESGSDIAALVRVAVCIRAHGFPQWPDPNGRGEFHVGSAVAGTPAKLGAAVSACDPLFPASGWHLIVTPTGR